MPMFTSRIVTVVRNAGTATETRREIRMGGDFASKALFQPEDRVVAGEEIQWELFDEPRIVTRVNPIVALDGVLSHWEAEIMTRSEWERLKGAAQAAADPALASSVPIDAVAQRGISAAPVPYEFTAEFRQAKEELKGRIFPALHASLRKGQSDLRKEDAACGYMLKMAELHEKFLGSSSLPEPQRLDRLKIAICEAEEEVRASVPGRYDELMHYRDFLIRTKAQAPTSDLHHHELAGGGLEPSDRLEALATKSGESWTPVSKSAEFAPDPPRAPSQTATTPLTTAPADPKATNGSESAQMLSDVKPSLADHLGEAQKLSNLRLRKMYEAVIRYNCYLEELRVLKVKSKKYQTPDLLKKQFPEFELWAILDKDDERDIADGNFDPGRFSWSLVKRLNGLRGKDDRTLKNYRRALRAAGISV
jgi:hypothetical protein